jgi:hypothetical protein
LRRARPIVSCNEGPYPVQERPGAGAVRRPVTPVVIPQSQKRDRFAALPVALVRKLLKARIAEVQGEGIATTARRSARARSAVRRIEKRRS